MQACDAKSDHYHQHVHHQITTQQHCSLWSRLLLSYTLNASSAANPCIGTSPFSGLAATVWRREEGEGATAEDDVRRRTGVYCCTTLLYMWCTLPRRFSHYGYALRTSNTQPRQLGTRSVRCRSQVGSSLSTPIQRCSTKAFPMLGCFLFLPRPGLPGPRSPSRSLPSHFSSLSTHRNAPH